MGTSASSRGPGGSVPLVPPWVPPVTPPASAPPANPPQVAMPNAPSSPGVPGVAPLTSPSSPATLPSAPTAPPLTPAMSSPLAPPGRFSGARLSLGKFAKSGSGGDLAKGLGRYTSKGLGGARRATQRLNGTARTAGQLYGVLDALRSGTTSPVDLGISTASLAGRSAKEVGDYIANALRPADGTQDAEAGRDALACAFADLIDADSTVDLMTLTPAQIDMVVERFIAYDICRRVELDVGKTLLEKAPSYAQALRRLEQMKAYIREKVALQFRTRESKGERLSRSHAEQMSREIIRDTFDVFEADA